MLLKLYPGNVFGADDPLSSRHYRKLCRVRICRNRFETPGCVCICMLGWESFVGYDKFGWAIFVSSRFRHREACLVYTTWQRTSMLRRMKTYLCFLPQCTIVRRRSRRIFTFRNKRLKSWNGTKKEFIKYPFLGTFTSILDLWLKFHDIWYPNVHIKRLSKNFGTNNTSRFPVIHCHSSCITRTLPPIPPCIIIFSLLWLHIEFLSSNRFSSRLCDWFGGRFLPCSWL